MTQSANSASRPVCFILVLGAIMLSIVTCIESLDELLQPEHKVPVQIDSCFSQESNMTVVIVSCHRFHLLELTLNSFFRYNTYVLRQIIIIEDCGGQETQIWDLLPHQAKSKLGFFKIIVNQQKLGQVGSIDRAYSEVVTKYVYHLEDDWLQTSGYGFLEQFVAVLESAQSQGINISQVVQTFPQWQWTHQPSMLNRTSNGIRFYLLSSYGKDYVYSYSFNPHLLRYDQIYCNIFNRSYTNSVARRYHCIQQNEGIELLAKGGCVEYQAGRHISKMGFRQAYVQIGKTSSYKHLGASGYKHNVKSLNFQTLGMQEQKSFTQDSSKKRPLQQGTSNPSTNNSIEASGIYSPDVLSQYLSLSVITMFALVGVYLVSRSCQWNNKARSVEKKVEANALKQRVIEQSDDDEMFKETESQMYQQQSSSGEDKDEDGDGDEYKDKDEDKVGDEDEDEGNLRECTERKSSDS